MEPTIEHRMTFVSDNLVEQIIEGRKTASVSTLESLLEEEEYDSPLVVGWHYTVYDSQKQPRVVIRVLAMELCRWDAIPERLWRGETNDNADEFREDHLGFFENPADDFEFAAYYFERVKVLA